MRTRLQTGLSTWEKGFVVGALLLPVLLGLSGLNVPLLGTVERSEGSLVALGAATQTTKGFTTSTSRGVRVSGKADVLLDDGTRSAILVDGAATSDETAGNGKSGGAPPAEGDPGRAGGGGSGAGSPGEPPGKPADPENEPADGGGASDPSPSPAPSPPPSSPSPPPVPAAEQDATADDSAVTVSVGAAGAEAEITVDEDGITVDAVEQETPALVLDLTLDGRKLLP